jgi:hypothetical protein
VGTTGVLATDVFGAIAATLAVANLMMRSGSSSAILRA